MLSSGAAIVETHTGRERLESEAVRTLSLPRDNSELHVHKK